MKTVVLRGKKAAGRVALVDDRDYELVSQHKWYVRESQATPTRRATGPYAIANTGRGRANRRVTSMHVLIMGMPGIDHINHDGLDNQRHNLRPANHGQNGANQRAQEGRSSQYKGVSWEKRRNSWRAFIKVSQEYRSLGNYASEVEAAYAYDTAAREAFGEFACTNFPEGPTRAMLDQWQAERAQRLAAVAAALEAARFEGHARWLSERQPVTHVCKECGKEYQSRSARSSYCSKACNWRRRSFRTRALTGRSPRTRSTRITRPKSSRSSPMRPRRPPRSR